MSQHRNPLPDDQKNIPIAYELINDLIKRNPNIDYNAWIGASFSVIVDCYLESDVSHKEFCDELDLVKDNYNSWWK